MKRIRLAVYRLICKKWAGQYQSAKVPLVLVILVSSCKECKSTECHTVHYMQNSRQRETKKITPRLSREQRLRHNNG